MSASHAANGMAPADSELDNAHESYLRAGHQRLRFINAQIAAPRLNSIVCMCIYCSGVINHEERDARSPSYEC